MKNSPDPIQFVSTSNVFILRCRVLRARGYEMYRDLLRTCKATAEPLIKLSKFRLPLPLCP